MSESCDRSFIISVRLLSEDFYGRDPTHIVRRRTPCEILVTRRWSRRYAHLHDRSYRTILEDGCVRRVAFVRVVAILLLRGRVSVHTRYHMPFCNTLALEMRHEQYFSRSNFLPVNRRFSASETVGRQEVMREVENSDLALFPYQRTGTF